MVWLGMERINKNRIIMKYTYMTAGLLEKLEEKDKCK